MVLSATSISQFHQGNSPWRLFNRQLLWAVLGVHRHVVRDAHPHPSLASAHAALRLPCATGLMVLPFVPGIGDSVNGANAWVAIGPFNFQPSEFLKLAVLLACRRSAHAPQGPDA
jgi:cell division protein FtsW